MKKAILTLTGAAWIVALSIGFAGMFSSSAFAETQNCQTTCNQYSNTCNTYCTSY